jgi:hypothetical protein
MTEHDPRAREKAIGHIQQLGGTRLVTLEDGVERGLRVVEFRTTTGLEFGVLVDRAMDIAWCRFEGRSIAWHSPVGFVGPWYREPHGSGFLRSFGGGLLVTCGLDHILGPEDDERDTYNLPSRARTEYGMHGRISNTPVLLRSYGEDSLLSPQECVLHAEGEVRQAGALAESLVLRRRISAPLDGQLIRWEDTVENVGSQPTPHMLMYHVNLGAPLLDASSELIAPSMAVTPSGDYDAHLEFHSPRAEALPQAYSHSMAARDGRVAVALVNRSHHDRPWGVVLHYDADRFPCFLQWRYLAERTYVLGLEPSTNRFGGRAEARARGELTILEPGETRSCETTIEILSGHEEVEAVRSKILGSS